MAIASEVERKLDAERFDKLHSIIVWDGLRPDCMPRSSAEDVMIQEMVEMLSDSPADSLCAANVVGDVIVLTTSQDDGVTVSIITREE